MIDIDHFAIAYIDGHAVNGFRIILPLGTHTAEAARSAIETYSLHQFHSESSEATDLYNVILQLSRMFSFSERAAICQSFLITATPTMCLRMPMIEKGMGFHTISPDHCVPFYGSAIPRGWHIFYDADGGGKDSGEGDLKAKVAKVVEHLRAGFDPGVVTNLKLDFIPGEDCEIQSVLGPRKLATLRPGEKWTVPIQTSVPAASLDRAVAEIDGCAWQHSTPAMKELMAQVDQLLKEYSRENITDYIMLAQLEYRHSLLPPDSTVHVERYCHVTRKEEASDKSWDICKPQRTREVSG